MTLTLKIAPAIRPVNVQAAVMAGMGGVLAAQVLASLILAQGHLVYAIEAPYTHLSLAQQIVHGHYGLSPDESSAPSSSILFPPLLAALMPVLGAAGPLLINILSVLATGGLAAMLAEECNLPLHQLGWARLCVLSMVMTLVLNLAGLAMTGLEHSLHVALTVAYLLGLVRFSRRGRCDAWWFAVILVQPLLRFEAAGMLVADVMIFLAFRRAAYAVLTAALGLLLVGSYSWFLGSLGLPLMPTSVLSRSDWFDAAVEAHVGPFAVLIGLLRNFVENLGEFGSAQILGLVVLSWLRLDRRDRTRLMTAFFITFVSLAQLAGGKMGARPPRYEAYVLALDFCGLAVIHGEAAIAWCARATWRRIAGFSAVLLVLYAGYAVQSLVALSLVRKEFTGPVQIHRFVTEFYRAPVASDRPGYIDFNQPFPVLDLSGLASEEARRRRAEGEGVGWMDDLLAARGIKLAIFDNGDDPAVPPAWTAVAELHSGNDALHHAVFYARRPEDIPGIEDALSRFQRTLPSDVHLVRAKA